MAPLSPCPPVSHALVPLVLYHLPPPSSLTSPSFPNTALRRYRFMPTRLAEPVSIICRVRFVFARTPLTLPPSACVISRLNRCFSVFFLCFDPLPALSGFHSPFGSPSYSLAEVPSPTLRPLFDKDLLFFLRSLLLAAISSCFQYISPSIPILSTSCPESSAKNTPPPFPVAVFMVSAKRSCRCVAWIRRRHCVVTISQTCYFCIRNSYWLGCFEGSGFSCFVLHSYIVQSFHPSPSHGFPSHGRLPCTIPMFHLHVASPQCLVTHSRPLMTTPPPSPAAPSHSANPIQRGHDPSRDTMACTLQQ
ncbi:hypothetical protein EDB81DRAFT_784885 [Dactylonectria macrodidyma]|uniref:Uncharacterized protein n=1 Tax=Dactylonectria macrodidyma TaxID=307937 RepID=A0A9P9FFS6_9HYPO|nr:hypothetical protein EDB81DRAFT_784885 [Dactylonectria macrodidyma]